MAQKYIVGDLIKYKFGSLEFIVEITNTSKYGYCFKGVSDDISGTLCKEFAKDIPLTTEILDKNGWEHLHDVYFKDYPQRKLVISDGEACIINESCSLFLCKVEFVHQLQHLLYSLGLNHEMEV